VLLCSAVSSSKLSLHLCQLLLQRLHCRCLLCWYCCYCWLALLLLLLLLLLLVVMLHYWYCSIH
jgi:hypothetical protein